MPVAVRALLDLGNRRLKAARAPLAGCAGPPALADLAAWRLPPPEGDWGEIQSGLARWLSEAPGAEVWMSSTNPGALERLVRGPLRHVEPRLAGEPWPFPVRSQGTGPDRVLACRAAWLRCQSALVVASLGTAWTLDLADRSGAFLGGAIGAGLGLQVASLARACPHLPAPGGADERKVGVPATSQGALAWGTAGALAEALEALGRRFEAAVGVPVQRFLTGGDAAVLAPWLACRWESAPHLVLEGLAAVASERDG